MQRIAWLVVLVACGADKKADAPPDPGSAGSAGSAIATPASDAGTAGSAETPKPKTLDAVQAWMPANAKQAWQGAWLTKLALRDSKGWAAYTGTHVALEVTGDRAKVWNTATNSETVLGFAAEFPCRATFTRKDDDGATHFYRRQYLVDGDKLFVGSGGAGYRKGKAALVCMNDDFYVLDEQGTCKKYAPRFDQVEVTDTTCTWKTEDGKELLVVDKDELGNRLEVSGNLLANIHFRTAFDGKDHVKQADFAAAKVAADKRFKETDPVEILKSRGARVGETKTIYDLQATFISDKASIKGKPIEISGKVLRVKQEDEGGKPEWRVVLVDPRDQEGTYEMVCRSPKPVKLKEGATARAKGTVGEWWDRAAVVDCAVR